MCLSKAMYTAYSGTYISGGVGLLFFDAVLATSAFRALDYGPIQQIKTEESQMLEAALDWVQDAHPIWYFLLLMAAGSGLGVSEDALSVWAGGLIGRGENPFPAEYYWGALYCGVVLSDCWTYCLGRLAQRAIGEKLKQKVFRDPEKVDKAMAKIQKYGNKIGFVQRFSVGARFGISFLSGFSGISAYKFAAGTALGALITLPVQLYVGYLMRNQIGQALDIIADYGIFVALGVLFIFGFVIWRKFQQDSEDKIQA